MNTARVLIAAVAGPGLLLACAAQPQAPAVDTAAEKAAVEKLTSEWSAATNQAGEAGADGYVADMADDVVVLPPNGSRVDGRQAVRDWAMQFTAATDWSVSWKATRVDVATSGDLAYAVGTYEFSLKDAEGKAVMDKGKFLDAYRKQADGSWKVTVVSFNSDLPVAGAAAQGN